MKLRELSFLADQNVRVEVTDWMREAGIDVLRCADAGLATTADPEILRTANREERVLLTHDTDFGELAVLRDRPHRGIVLVRPGHNDRVIVTQQLGAALDVDVPNAGRWLMTIDIRDGEARIRLRS